jgi:hypothetical protein
MPKQIMFFGMLAGLEFLMGTLSGTILSGL